MAVQASDDFADLADAASPNGRTLNNALGGSGTRTWSGNPEGVDSGSLLFGAGDDLRVDYGSAADLKTKISFVLNGTGKNWVAFGRGPSSGRTSMFGALLVGQTSLRVAEWDSGGTRTDRATKAITSLSTTTTYKLEFEINGLDCTARILNADDSLYDEVSYTAAATPGGTQQFWGFFDLSGSSPSVSRFDDPIIQDLAGGSVGSASGTSTVSGVGASIAESTGSATGTGAASGVGASIAQSVGTSSGVGAATGVGASIAQAVGSASGTSTVSGVGDSTSAGNAAGSAAGTSSVTGVGASVAEAVGSAAGASTVAGFSGTAQSSTHDGGDGFTPQEAARRKRYYKELDERREKEWEKRKGKKRRKPKPVEPTIEPTEQVTPPQITTVEQERAATQAMLDLRNVELQQARMRREKDDMEAMMILMAA